MKKMLAVLLVVSLLFAVAIPVFAGANVDAITDAKQSEIAKLVLSSIDKGNDPETIKGRESISIAVVNGIVDFSPYKTDYEADPSSISVIVSSAVNAVKSDKGFSDITATKLTTLLTSAIVSKVIPETSTTPTETTTEAQTASGNLEYIVKLLADLTYDQKQATLVSFVGNKVITVDEAKAVINSLYKDKKITSEEKDKLYAAIVSEEASTGVVDKFFEGYTPTDLAQLFRGFGDSIGTMTSKLAELFRSSGGSSGDGTTGDNNNTSNPTDIPATGDYAIVSVAGIAVVAGLALVLTKKKKDD